jgi:hypothetical protein
VGYGGLGFVAMRELPILHARPRDTGSVIRERRPSESCADQRARRVLNCGIGCFAFARSLLIG